jgi:hypothetical protein
VARGAGGTHPMSVIGRDGVILGTFQVARGRRAGRDAALSRIVMPTLRTARVGHRRDLFFGVGFGLRFCIV